MVAISNPSYTISAKFFYSASKYKRKAIKGLNLKGEDHPEGYTAEDAINFLYFIADLCGARLDDIQISQNNLVEGRSLF